VSPSIVLHHHEQRQAPRGDFHGTPLRRIEIGQEVIAIEGAELGAQRHVEVAFGKSGMYRRSRRL
jgi:hypothetical protein